MFSTDESISPAGAPGLFGPKTLTCSQSAHPISRCAASPPCCTRRYASSCFSLQIERCHPVRANRECSPGDSLRIHQVRVARQTILLIPAAREIGQLTVKGNISKLLFAPAESQQKIVKVVSFPISIPVPGIPEPSGQISGQLTASSRAPTMDGLSTNGSSTVLKTGFPPPARTSTMDTVSSIRLPYPSR